MAQVLSVLALSTKEMKEMRFSGFICSISSSLVDYGTEKFVKRIAGRTDVEDALQRLDVLTKEECLMTSARNLEVTHRVEEVIHDVDGDVKETKELTRGVHDNLVTIDDNVKVTRHGAPNLLDIFAHLTDPCPSVVETAIDEQRRSFLRSTPVFHLRLSKLRHNHREAATRGPSRMALPSESLDQS